MCRLLRVSRSGYYDWGQRAESVRSLRDRELRLLIRQIHLESGGVCTVLAKCTASYCASVRIVVAAA